MALIECVPNVSEGRRPDVVNAIAEAVSQVEGVRLLDRSSDEAHNRSVLTFAGAAPAMRQAVLALFDAALDLIDLRQHTGAHPRLGAVDVVPFVPLKGATMAQCVALARETAATVAARFQLPVYLYEEAAATPDRRNLADIRRGEFEGLAVKDGVIRMGAGLRSFAPTSERRRQRDRRAGAADRVQRQPRHRSAGHRQGRGRGGETEQRRAALRESTWHRSSRIAASCRSP